MLKRIWPSHQPDKPSSRSFFAMKKKERDGLKILEYVVTRFDIFNLVIIARLCVPVEFAILHEARITSDFLKRIFVSLIDVQLIFAWHNSSAQFLVQKIQFCYPNSCKAKN